MPPTAFWTRLFAGLALGSGLAMAACEEAQVRPHLAWERAQGGTQAPLAPDLEALLQELEGPSFEVLAVATYAPRVPTTQMDQDLLRVQDGVASAALRTMETAIRACPGLSTTVYTSFRDQVATDIATYRQGAEVLRQDLNASPPTTITAARAWMLAATNNLRSQAVNLNANLQLRVRTLSYEWVVAGRPRAASPSPRP